MYNYTRSTGTRKVAGVLTGGKIYSGETEHHVVLYCGFRKGITSGFSIKQVKVPFGMW